eukprot:gb/GECG01014058.1/.p1 GENE.gb/GECG01014058.1/~~gb/GECG01014058.1/.p1  ORF type:complete len:2323 (+),score=191.31 gb/GECG01014058.1/:1-6969(+)
MTSSRAPNEQYFADRYFYNPFTTLYRLSYSNERSVELLQFLKITRNASNTTQMLQERRDGNKSRDHFMAQLLDRTGMETFFRLTPEKLPALADMITNESLLGQQRIRDEMKTLYGPTKLKKILSQMKAELRAAYGTQRRVASPEARVQKLIRRRETRRQNAAQAPEVHREYLEQRRQQHQASYSLGDEARLKRRRSQYHEKASLFPDKHAASLAARRKEHATQFPEKNASSLAARGKEYASQFPEEHASTLVSRREDYPSQFPEEHASSLAARREEYATQFPEKHASTLANWRENYATHFAEVSVSTLAPRGKDYATEFHKRRSDAARKKAENQVKDLVSRHVNCRLGDPPSSQRQQEILDNIRAELKPSKNIQLVCIVCDLTSVQRNGKLLTIQEFLSIPNLALLDANHMHPPLDPLLQSQYNITDDLVQTGIPKETVQEKVGNLLLSPRATGTTHIFMCCSCKQNLMHQRLPKMAIANHNAIGHLPTQLGDLTEMERRLCSPVVVRSVLQTVRGGQANLESHVALMEAPLQDFVTSLPNLRALDSIRVITTNNITSLLGRWDTLKFVEVRLHKVRLTLQFLMEHHPFYQQNIHIDEDNFRRLEESIDANNHIPSGVLQQVNMPEDESTPLSNHATDAAVETSTEPTMRTRDMIHSNECIRPSFEEISNGFIQQMGKFEKDTQPNILGKAFATGFPFGRGGLDEPRTVPLSEQSLLQRLLLLSSNYFQTKIFTGYCFDTLSKRKGTKTALLTLPAQRYKEFQTVSVEGFEAALDYKAQAETALRTGLPMPFLPQNIDTLRAVALLNHCDLGSQTMNNSSAQRVGERKKVFALITLLGFPCLFLTLSTSDLHDPTLIINAKSLSMKSLQEALDTIDNLPELPSRAQREACLASNPVAPVRRFSRELDYYIEHILGYDMSRGKAFPKGGVFGNVMALIGSVEGQERGNLHVHLLVWLESIPPTTSTMHTMLQSPEYKRKLHAMRDAVVTATYALELPCKTCSNESKDFVHMSPVDPATKVLPQSTPEPCTVKCRTCKTPLQPHLLLLAKAHNLLPQEASLLPEAFLHKLRCGYYDTLQGQQKDAALFLAQYYTCGHKHTHSFTCFSVKKVNGANKGECRFHFPKVCISEQEWKADSKHQELTAGAYGDTGTFRGLGSAWLNAHNLITLLAYGCNNDVKFITDGSSALAHYMYAYGFKSQQTGECNKRLLQQSLKTRKSHEDYENQNQTLSLEQEQARQIRQGRQRVLALLMASTSKLTTGLQLCAWYVLRKTSTVTSHAFAIIHMPHLLAFLSGNDLSFQVAPYQQRGLLQTQVPYIYDYVYRGDALQTFPYYLVSSLYYKLPKRAPPESVDDEEDADHQDTDTYDNTTSLDNDTNTVYGLIPNDPTMRLLLHKFQYTADTIPRRVPFTDQHPQADTHQLVLRRRAYAVISNGRRMDDLSILSIDVTSAVCNTTTSAETATLGNPDDDHYPDNIHNNEHDIRISTNHAATNGYDHKDTSTHNDKKVGNSIHNPADMKRRQVYLAKYVLGLLEPFREPPNDDENQWISRVQSFIQTAQLHKHTSFAWYILCNLQDHYESKQKAQEEARQREAEQQVDVRPSPDNQDQPAESPYTAPGDAETSNDLRRHISQELEKTTLSAMELHIASLDTTTFPYRSTYQEASTRYLSIYQGGHILKAWDDIKQLSDPNYSTANSDDLSVNQLVETLQNSDDARHPLEHPAPAFLAVQAILGRQPTHTLPSAHETPELRVQDSFPSIQTLIDAFELNEVQGAAFRLLTTALLLPLIKNNFSLFMTDSQKTLAEMAIAQANAYTTPIHDSHGVSTGGIRILIHGAGGTGKSYIIRTLRCFAERWQLSNSLRVTATTGSAAILIGGTTYHSLLGFSKYKNIRKHNECRYRAFQEISCIVIDEMSMLGQNGLQLIDSQLRKLRNTPHTPFGGISIALFGDFYQLPAVQDTPLYASGAFSDRFAPFLDTSIYLEANIRAQTCSTLSRVCTALRLKQDKEFVFATVNERVLPVPTNAQYVITATPSHIQRRTILQSHYRQAAEMASNGLHPTVYAFRAEFEQRENNRMPQEDWNEHLKHWYNTPDEHLEHRCPILYCWISMRVIILDNLAVHLGVANGTLGEIVGFAWNSTTPFQDAQQVLLDPYNPGTSPLVTVPTKPPLAILVRLLNTACQQRRATVHCDDLPDDVVPIVPTTIHVKKQFKAGPILHAKMTQFPMMCSDALTMHKLQGHTINCTLLINSLSGLRHAEAYTALSRARNINQVHFLQPLQDRTWETWTTNTPHQFERTIAKIRASGTALMEYFRAHPLQEHTHGAQSSL